MLGESVDSQALITKISLDSACERVRSYLGQTVYLVTDDVEVHCGAGRRKMRLRQRPVRSVTSITEDSVLVESTAYNVRSAIVTRLDFGWWNPGDDNIVVTYTHGYDLDEGATKLNVPADIRLVALNLARRVYTDVSATVGTRDVISETIGDYSYQLSDAAQEAANELFEAEKMVLDKYRVPLVGDTPSA